MTLAIALFLVILLVAGVLFSLEWIPADVVALGAVLALTLTGVLAPDKVFLGFGSDTVLMIFGLLVLSAALERTGVIEIVGSLVFRIAKERERVVLPAMVVATAFLSAFMSNTAATAFFLPLVLGVARRASISPSRLLMPVAFASIVTSSATLISTSTNLVVNGLMVQYGLEPMGMFELTPVGIVISIAGIAYMLTLGRRLVPERAPPSGDADRFGLQPYLSEVLVLPGSPLAGRRIGESNLGRDLDLTVLTLIRGEDRFPGTEAGLTFQAGDVLVVEGRRENILKVKDVAGIEIRPEVKLPPPGKEAGDLQLAEVIVMPGSPLIGRTLKSQRFRDRYRLQVLAISRHHGTLHEKLSDVHLRLGDVLVVQGPPAAIAKLEEERVTRVVGLVDHERVHRHRAPLAAASFCLAIVLAATQVVSTAIAVLLGVLAAFLTRCITPEEAYRRVEWKVIILIGCMLSIGTAMRDSGSADYLASLIVGLVGEVSPLMLLGGFFALAVLLTQPMSNQAAAVVLVPVAIQTAWQLGLDPRPFALGIAIAASCSYLTPLEPACLMVYTPGRYRFFDFARVGAPLTLIIFVIAMLLVPVFWPLRPAA